MIYSYDLFDTLITRKFYKPTDLFVYLEQILKNKQIIDTNINFSYLRQKSENELRKFKNNEVTLDEIYTFMLSLESKLTQEIITKCKLYELNLEMNSFSPISKYINEQSNKIIITDTYFNRQFIEQTLEKFNIQYKDLFISSELGLTKNKGTIYPYILKQYKKLQLHIGDNIHSDINRAQQHNIHTYHYKDSKPTRYEKVVSKYNSLFSGCMKSLRLNHDVLNDDDLTLWNITTNVISPFLFLYSQWILEQANNQKINTLYFMARDGQILFEICKLIQEFDDSYTNIELKYLYGSRKSLNLPSIDIIDDYAIDIIFKNINDKSNLLNQLIDNLNLDDDETIEFIDKIQSIILIKYIEQTISIDEFKDIFKTNINFQNYILTIIKKKQELVIEYLKQEGFCIDKNIGIVDVGWLGKQQYSLSKILDIGNIYPKNGITGFYININKNKQFKKFKNDKVNTFLTEQYIFDFAFMIELFVTAKHGSCIGYFKNETNIEPILRNNKTNINTNIVFNGVLTFTKTYLDMLKKMDIKEIINNKKEISNKLLNFFLFYPTYNESSLFSKITFFDDANELDQRIICKKNNLLNLIINMIKYDKTKGVWNNASLKLNNDKISLYIYKFIYNLKLMLKQFIKG